MFGNAAAMLWSGWAIGRQKMLFVYLAMIVLIVNLSLTVTDQFGLWDMITMLIDLVLLVLLVLASNRNNEGKNTPRSGSCLTTSSTQKFELAGVIMLRKAARPYFLIIGNHVMWLFKGQPGGNALIALQFIPNSGGVLAVGSQIQPAAPRPGAGVKDASTVDVVIDVNIVTRRWKPANMPANCYPAVHQCHHRVAIIFTTRQIGGIWNGDRGFGSCGGVSKIINFALQGMICGDR